MALTGCDTANYRLATDISAVGITSGETVVIMARGKFASGVGLLRGLCSLAESSSSSQCLGFGLASTNHLSLLGRSNTTLIINDSVNTALTTQLDAWAHYALIVEGPHDGTAGRVWEARVNDAVWDSGTFTSQNYPSATLARMQAGRNVSTVGNAADKLTYLGVAGVASLAAARSLVTAALAVLDPGTLTDVAAAWPLVANATNSKGGIDLTAVGTGGTFDADAPTLGGASAQVIVGFGLL
jgi:hypothetical protein